jgi:uroporphyrin-III C-methyltransferase
MRPETLQGDVRLVGAGPGPVDLLTLRAAEALGSAGAVLYDALVDPQVLKLAPGVCLKIQTGKRAGRPSMSQSTINRLMLRLARRGLRVVRLKGGDPSVFGRVGEELEFLKDHGVCVEVVPGVTAACAAAAQFQFPLTHRLLARRVIFTTATLQAGRLQTDWRLAADRETTLAIYMGGARLGELARLLISAGRSADTVVAIIENAGSPHARLERLNLGDAAARETLGDAADGTGGGPVLVVVGDVAALIDAAAEPARSRALAIA